MAVHPGMMIKPELEERGISQKDFTIPVGDRNLLRELVRRFGWVGVF